jgi:hypothetical protein
LIASLCIVPIAASAQTNGFPQLGNIGPSKGEVIGVAIGVGLVITLVVYLSVPKQSTIEGCVETVDGVSHLKDGNKHHEYQLISSDIPLKSGERLRLKGKKHKGKNGGKQFTVKKLIADLGACEAAPSPPQS